MTESRIIVTAPVQATIVRSTSGPQGPHGPAGPPGVTPVFSRTGALEVDQGRSRFYADQDVTITRIRAAVGTPPEGAPVIVEVVLDGTVIGEVEIPTEENTALLNVDVPFLIGQFVAVNITQVGTTASGQDLTVTITTE